MGCHKYLDKGIPQFLFQKSWKMCCHYNVNRTFTFVKFSLQLTQNRSVLFLKKWFLRNEISQRMARQIKTNFINEWRGEAESWVYEICFDLPSHELWYFISQKPLFQKFHFNFLYKELDSWNVFISCTSPWYIISQNHISKSFLKIFAKNLC